jgi:hypothetical protein
MRNGLIVTSVLGLGTAAVFALAALASAAFPQGGTVVGMWNGGWSGGVGIAKPMPAPIARPMPVPIDQGLVTAPPDAVPGNDNGSTSSGASSGVVITPPDAGGFPVTPSDAPPAK